MPITITINDPTPEQIAALFGPKVENKVTIDGFIDKPKATRTKSSPKVETPTVEPEDAELARELAADVAEAPPEPKGATQVLDAGTGKPMEQVASEREMSMDEVRSSATRLAQADATKLKAILGEFGAAKLSEVKPEDLPDFAGRVLAALG